MSSLVDGLGANGTMMVVGASTDPIEVSPVQLIFGKRSIKGWAVRHSHGFRRYAALRGNDRRASHDRKISAGEGRRGLRAHDEREGGVSRRADDVSCLHSN